jgi:hypothetical protein
MVSGAYMKQYMAERNARPETGSRGREVGSESHWISGLDGNGSYEAVWDTFLTRWQEEMKHLQAHRDARNLA